MMSIKMKDRNEKTCSQMMKCMRHYFLGMLKQASKLNSVYTYNIGLRLQLIGECLDTNHFVGFFGMELF